MEALKQEMKCMPVGGIGTELKFQYPYEISNWLSMSINVEINIISFFDIRHFTFLITIIILCNLVKAFQESFKNIIFGSHN